jgi:transitional endoplasmic reticulum ATPase
MILRGRLLTLLQNLQQSRGFGSFKFPEGQPGAGGGTAPSQANAAFQEAEEDDLYA